ncbi:inositol polyphosphate kinase-domain-containing protein, partial [Lineolata rhizophorae]
SDGVLADPSGEMIIKPCTADEIAFYESANSSHPAFAAYMPTYMGTLSLDKPEAAESAAATAEPTASGTAATLGLDDVGPMHGKALETSRSIVLQNVAAGFSKPNILDIKLGAVLYDAASTRPEKRARLDKVAAETTSAPLGFRVAGMRVWQGAAAAAADAAAGSTSGVAGTDDTVSLDRAANYKEFNKIYGRVFSADNVLAAFREYAVVPAAGVTPQMALDVIRGFRAELQNVQRVLEQEESRMFSASLLFVYEGDPSRYKAAKEAERTTPAKAKAVEDDDAESEDEPPKVSALKMIDFAHASWTPGLGPDENALKGVRNVGKILEDLYSELEVAQDQAAGGQ